MSFSTRISITDNATPEVQAKIALFRGALNPVMGRAVENVIKANFLRWNAGHANKLGGPRTNLGAQFARATQMQVLADGFVVSVNHVAARQRLEGGTIKPVNAKMLTIPAAPEAYGKRAGEFHNLRFAVLGGKPALVEADATQVKRTKKDFKAGESVGGKVMYWLARSINQVADPSVLPTESEMVAAALQAAENTINRTNARNKGGTQ